MKRSYTSDRITRLSRNRPLQLTESQRAKSKMIAEKTLAGTICNGCFNQRSHIERHMHKTPEDILNRLFDEDKSAIGLFTSTKTGHEMLENAIFANADGIAHWSDYADDGDRLCIGEYYETDEDEAPIGFTYEKEAYTNKIAEYKTNFYLLILEKDRYADLGIAIITVYPARDINYEATPTGRNLTRYVTRTYAYQHGTPLKQAFLTACADPDAPHMRMQYEPETYQYQESINLTIPADNNMSHVIHLADKKLTLQTFHNHKCIPSPYDAAKKYINLQSDPVKTQFAKEFPAEAQFIRNLYASAFPPTKKSVPDISFTDSSTQKQKNAPDY